eukprot:9488844-Pyramimonas_sp.AAC.1
MSSLKLEFLGQGGRWPSGVSSLRVSVLLLDVAVNKAAGQFLPRVATDSTGDSKAGAVVPSCLPLLLLPKYRAEKSIRGGVRDQGCGGENGGHRMGSGMEDGTAPGMALPVGFGRFALGGLLVVASLGPPTCSRNLGTLLGPTWGHLGCPIGASQGRVFGTRLEELAQIFGAILEDIVFGDHLRGHLGAFWAPGSRPLGPLGVGLGPFWSRLGA